MSMPWERYDGDYTSGWGSPAKKKAAKKAAAKKTAAKPKKARKSKRS